MPPPRLNVALLPNIRIKAGALDFPLAFVRFFKDCFVLVHCEVVDADGEVKHDVLKRGISIVGGYIFVASQVVGWGGVCSFSLS